jgi:adenosylcobinamide kinase/adenosylcobinamide-phosphate guanylyltransferase
MGRLTLITGGARSGKSRFAQALASRTGGENVLFVATAEALDDEMARRIAAHRESRPATWRTIEAPRDVGRTIQDQLGESAVVLIDCITLLVSNSLLSLGAEPDAAEAEQCMAREIAEILGVADSAAAAFVIVSGEVGLGLVPANPLGRLYRDLLGLANQVIAARAESVILMVAGIPVDLKALAAPPSGDGPRR